MEQKLQPAELETAQSAEAILRVENLKKHFLTATGLGARKAPVVKAVDGVGFWVYPGQTLGLVGESGCGKTTVGKSIIRLYEPTEGKIVFRNQDITALSQSELRSVRRHMQMIFQDPDSSLNRRKTIGQIIGLPLSLHRIARGKHLEKKVDALLEVVGLSASFKNRYPHEFSGGQRQRIGIARALAVDPELIVADEPVSALDVSIQAQIVNLLMNLQEEYGISYVFVAHDLSVVRHISHHVGVMYLGNIVEFGDTDTIFADPLHPYTVALMSAVPRGDRRLKKQRVILEGEVPSPINPPSGCKFRTRCPQYLGDICLQKAPGPKEVAPSHWVACHLFN